MSSPIIPKEQLTAFQRWELAGFDDHPGTGSAKSEPDPLPEVALPTAEQIEQIHQQAAQEGFKMGQEEGYKAGYDAGRKAARNVMARLAQLSEDLDRERLRQDEAIAGEVLDLALAVARQMVRSALQVKEGLVVEAVREAMAALPSLSGHLRVHAHPDDVDALRQFIETEHNGFSFRIVADERVERGGFRLEASHSEVDARLPVRWREIVACLGNESEWLE